MNGRTTGKLVFDSCAVIPALQNKSILTLLDRYAEWDRFISVITRIELLSYHLLSEEEAELISRFLDNVTVIPLTAEVEHGAIAFRRVTNRKTPDSIIAATALVLDADLVTADPHLTKLAFPGLRLLLP
jgi:predicted nucleic acid-binding protein